MRLTGVWLRLIRTRFQPGDLRLAVCQYHLRKRVGKSKVKRKKAKRGGRKLEQLARFPNLRFDSELFPFDF
jgi:hypothetical protein